MPSAGIEPAFTAAAVRRRPFTFTSPVLLINIDLQRQHCALFGID